MRAPAGLSRYTRWETMMLALLVAVSFLTRVLYMYRGGMPEADSILVAAGVALGATGDLPFSETFLYGRQLNPGVYLFMRAAHPALWSDPANLVSLLNWLSVICGTLTVLLLHDLCRVHLSGRVALVCAGIWAFTPLVWEAQTSFHPIVPATFFLLTALACARRAGWGFFLSACVFASAAMITRSDVAVVWPAIAVFALAAKNRRHALLELIVCTAAAVVVYAVVLRLTAGDMGSGGRSMGHLWNRWSGMYGMSSSLHGIPRSLAWAFMGLGVATLGACLAGLVRVARMPREDRGFAPMLGGLLWAVPSLVFWAPYVVPILRHYYLASIGFAWLLGFLLLRGMKTRPLAVVSLAVIAFNLLVPDVLYRAYNRTQPTAKIPHGSFFYGHEFATRDVERLVRLRESALTCVRSDDGRVRSVVLCRWDAFANLLYGVASRDASVARVDQNTLFPEVVHSHYASAGADVQLIRYIYMDDEALREKVTGLLLDAWRDGYCIFLPQSIRPLDGLHELPGVYDYP